MLSEADQERIAAAVAEAEAKTSGEIVCALTEEVSHYREIPIAWAAGAALLLPPVAVFAGLRLDPGALSGAGWRVAHGAAEGLALGGYALLQAAVFAAVLAFAAVPAARRRLTPQFLKERRVRQAAVQQFAGLQAHLQPGRTAVLIFASLTDRQMEVVAHQAVAEVVEPGVWDKVVAEALAVIRTEGTAAGLARAATLCGEILARHFPDDGAAGEGLPNRPLQV